MCAAADQTAAPPLPDAGSVAGAVETLQRAAAASSVPPISVFQALRALEKAKLPSEGWAQALGATPGGQRWRLVFTSGAKQVQQRASAACVSILNQQLQHLQYRAPSSLACMASVLRRPAQESSALALAGAMQVREAMKGVSEGGGQYFPLTAVQRWDRAAGTIENGVFLGHIAALKFSGPYAMVGKKLTFDFDTLSLKLGPLKFDFPLKKKVESYTPGPKDPFFLVFYVDNDVVAARGKGGGVAYWARTSPQWELERGIV